MLRVGIVEDDIEHLVGVIRSLMALKQHRRDFEIVPVLLSDPEIDTSQAIDNWSEEEKEPLKNAGIDVSSWPKIEQKGKLCPVDPEHCAEILDYLASQDVHVIISDSWMGRGTESGFSESDLKLAGVRLLDAAERDERWKGKCWLMTKFGNDVMSELVKVAGWRPEVFNPLNFEDYRYIDKSKVHDVIPGEWETQLERVIEEGIARMRLAEPIKLPPEVTRGGKFGDMIGASEPMLKVYRTILQVAETDATVLILGEIGTGKDLIACEIHQRSRRSKKTRVDINCAGIPKELVSSELFGHEPGAFTGAFKLKKGLFEVADKGTLFLDEIGEMPFDTQAALLRAIQQRVIRRVGGTVDIRVDVRIIAATNQVLANLVKEGRFNEALYSRLEVITIKAPPLRERREDIRLLVDHFIKKFNEQYKDLGKRIDSISKTSLKILEAYDWPQNVRELENRIHAAFIYSQDKHTLDEDNPSIRDIENLLSQQQSPLQPQADLQTSTITRENGSRAASEDWQQIKEGKLTRKLSEEKKKLGDRFPYFFKLLLAWLDENYGNKLPPEKVTKKMFDMTNNNFKKFLHDHRKKPDKPS